MADRKKRQQSSIDLLPDAVRQLLQEMLLDRKLTQKTATDRINAALMMMQEQGTLPPEAPAQVSKSAVNRYALDMDQAGAKLRQSREVAEMWIGKLGAAPQGQVGNLVNEILRTLSFDVSLMLSNGGIDPDNAPEVVAMLKDLALTSQRLEQASTLNVKREGEIKKQAIEKAADVAEKTLAGQGMSRESIDTIKREILGIA